ncbi:MAG: recombination-associated protein RdgC [Myxococcota bacterium]
MGLLNGGLNGRRFRVSRELPAGFRDTFLEQVRAAAFVECDTAADTEPRIGWVDVFDPAITTFELNNLLYDRFIAVSLRADTKKIQAAYLKIASANRIAQVCQERGLEKLSKAEKELVTEALEADLLRRALPSVATTDVVWDIETGSVMVFSTSETPLEQVRQLAKETFGISLAPERMVDWLTDKLDKKEVTDRVTNHLGGFASEDDPLEGKEFQLASDFLTWLWLQSETTDGMFRVLESTGPRAVPAVSRDEADDEESDEDAETVLADADAEDAASDGAPAVVAADDADDDDEPEVTERLRHSDLALWIDTRLALRELTDDDPETTILIGAAPSATPEARRGLNLGKRPVDAKVGLKLNDLECAMALQATPDGLRISGLKIPFAVKTGRDERLFERATLLDLLHTTIAHLFRQFFLDRTSPVWAERIEPFVSAEPIAAK